MYRGRKHCFNRDILDKVFQINKLVKTNFYLGEFEKRTVIDSLIPGILGVVLVCLPE